MGVEERLTLEATSAHTLIATEHVHRYKLAASVCDGARVLDLACGSGYGSRILRASAASVTGVDNDEATVRAAQASVGEEEDIEFITADAAEYLESPAASGFDAIVCFEGLEHVPDPGRVLTAMESLAKAGKKLVFSVPNSKAFHEENEFHVTDFGFEEAMAAFDRFDDSYALFQFMAEGSLIRTGDGSGDVDARIELSEHGEKEYANHFICFVNCRPDGVSDGRMQLTAAPAYNRYVINLERAMREMWQTNSRLGRDRIGVADSAGAAVLSRFSDMHLQLEQAEHRAGVFEAEVERIKAWYDAPRYHFVDRIRTILQATGIHGLLKKLLRR
jgi:2-polyprenyl-3-methyl-5-hydroxy-6-metoxy-1,4-benzoquinol methylase